MLTNDIKHNIQIADDCMSVITGISATSVDGVANLGNGLTKKILPFLDGNNLKKGIEIKKTNEGLSVNVSITIKNNYDISKVCTSVQEKVKEALESMLDLHVKEVSVNVSGVEVGE